MLHFCRISGVLHNIFLCVQIVNLKLSIWNKHRLSGLAVLFYDTELCCKFTVNEYSPHLRLGRVVLCDVNLKRLDFLYIVRYYRFHNHIGSVRNRLCHQMPLAVRIKGCFPV